MAETTGAASGDTEGEVRGSRPVPDGAAPASLQDAESGAHSMSASGDCPAADGDNTDDRSDEEDCADDEEETEVTPAVPDEYRHLLGERPTFWYEKESEFDDFEEAVFAELRPKGLIECILVRDFVECEWELRRTRRLARAAVYSSLPGIATDLLAAGKGGLLEHVHDQGLLASLARGSAMGATPAKSALKARAADRHLRPVDLHLEAHRDALPLLDALGRDTARLQRRRDQLLRQIEDRRATLGAMARSLVARGEAETIEPAYGTH